MRHISRVRSGKVMMRRWVTNINRGCTDIGSCLSGSYMSRKNMICLTLLQCCCIILMKIVCQEQRQKQVETNKFLIQVRVDTVSTGVVAVNAISDGMLLIFAQLN